VSHSIAITSFTSSVTSAARGCYHTGWPHIPQFKFGKGTGRAGKGEVEESRLGGKIIKRREVNRDKRIMWGGEETARKRREEGGN